MEKDIIAGLLGEWSEGNGVWAIVFKVLVAITFSAIIGNERARKRHAAGLRTFMLVSLGAVVSGISDSALISSGAVSFPVISAAFIVGIAIISCNAILYSSKNQLKGLTTSICLWVSGVISAVLGFGMYTLFLAGAITLVLTLMIFPRLETRFKDRSNHFEVHLELESRNSLRDFLEAVRKFGIKVNDIEINPAYANTGLGVYSLILTVEDPELKKKTHGEIIEIISSLECVHFIEKIS